MRYSNLPLSGLGYYSVGLSANTYKALILSTTLATHSYADQTGDSALSALSTVVTGILTSPDGTANPVFDIYNRLQTMLDKTFTCPATNVPT